MTKAWRPLLTLLLFWLTGCAALSWQRATPAAVVEDMALQIFLTRAPVPLRVTATPTPAQRDRFVVPAGLPLPLVDPLTVVGDLTISGSSALAPLTRHLYAGFISAGYRDTMRIEEVSADTVFTRYCTQAPSIEGALDIVMADRPMKQSELELCLQNKRRPIALQVALNAVVLVSQADADFVDSMSKSELVKLLTAREWSDIRHGWPAAAVVRITPPLGSKPTTLLFSKILRGNASLLQNAPQTTLLEDSQEIAFRIADTPYSVGLLDFADYQQSQSALHLWAIDGIRPTGETVSNGAYALTYPLLLYTDEATLTARTQVGAFLLYYLANMHEALADVGNFPVGEAGYERTKTVLLTALGQEAYLVQFPPTSTPAPSLTATPTVAPATR